MTLFLHEWKRGRLALLIWSLAVSFMLFISILIYPEMTSQMGEMGDMFSEMGSFSDAFGLDSINFAEFGGYFAIEFGNTVGLAGGLFAAILGMAALADEERNHTAEFLLTHPVSRNKIVTQKLLALLARIVTFDLVIAAFSALGILVIGETPDVGKVALVFLASLLLQIEIASISFGLSAFIRRGGVAIGLGISLGFYFLQILSNLAEELEFITYLTPYGFADATVIISEGKIEGWGLLVGLFLTALGVVAAFWQYNRKDIL